MIKIPLTQKRFALVDDCDSHLAEFKWFLKNGGQGYAVRNVVRPDGKTRMMFLHHAIVGFPLNRFKVDHRDGNSLDNRRSNLHFVTDRENSHNQKAHRGEKKKSSKYIGVYWNKKAAPTVV